MRSLVSGLVAIQLLLAPGSASAQVSCGDVIEKRSVSLAADLDCTGSPDEAVTLRHGRLRLNGFTVRGGAGIQCSGSCTVLGPGTVEKSSASGIWSNTWFATRYRVSNVTIRDNALWGIAGYLGVSNGQSVIALRNSTVESNGLSGILGDSLVSISGSTIRDNGTVNGGVGVAALYGDVVVRSSTVEGNLGEGIFAWGDVRAARSSVTGNLLGGIVAGYGCFLPGAARVAGSIVMGNALGTCAAGECTDIASCLPPTVRGTACETTHRIASGLPGDDWGVCAQD